MDRRGVLRIGGALLVAPLFGGCGGEHEDEPEVEESGAEVTPENALTRLRYGNQRFVAGNATHPRQNTKYRAELDAGQHPFATILSCVDSRVPPELVFDSGLGDLFVSRTAGQVVDQAVLGSIQFGVHELHIPLIVVLGHSKCGAVKATVEAVEKGSAQSGTAIDVLVTAIRPAVDAVRGSSDVLGGAVDKNIENVTAKLRGAGVIKDEVAKKEVQVVGARYDLATGKVTFFDS
jgi:carbonic anhydrase